MYRMPAYKYPYSITTDYIYYITVLNVFGESLICKRL